MTDTTPTALHWTPRPLPSGARLQGTTCQLEAFAADKHAAALFTLLNGDADHWRHLPYGPFSSFKNWESWLASLSETDAGAMLYAITTQEGQPLGFAGYRQIVPAHGAIEIGHVNFSSVLRRTRRATEALYLLLRQVFALGYRRCEWRCDSHNTGSAGAAERLGFRFEGTLRQAMVIRDRNRDSHVFSMLDSEWPAHRKAMEAFLSDSNFDAHGQQIQPLRTQAHPRIFLKVQPKSPT